MEMDMDVAWCLTCSTQMNDPRSPYCSETCRLQDTDPSSGSSQPVPLTSPVPPGLIPSHPSRPTAQSGQRSAYASIPSGRRPTISPFVPVMTSSSSSTRPPTRDRRAFSFPVTEPMAPAPLSRNGSRRQTNATLQFARKTNALPTGPTNLPGLPGSVKGKATKGLVKVSKTTGANTPNVPDSVFCSTSEGSDCGAGDWHEGSPVKSSKSLNTLPTFGRITGKAQRPQMPKPLTAVSPKVGAFPATLITARPHLISRKSPSPVAAMIASSASSKSREDIVSWLNEVKRLPADDSIEGTMRPRGRSRTRRDVLAELPPSDQQPLDDHDIDSALGTTPKGRIGSAIAGLSSLGGFSVAPIVKALTGAAVSSTTHVQSATGVDGLGLQSVPAPAEVSRIAVTTLPGELDATHMLQMGGATPTLSTVSFSEVIDPLTDNGEHLDFYTDDQSLAGSSAFARHVSLASGRAAATLATTANNNKENKSTTNHPTLPRPIANTASAIWNLSAYLRSFAPFSISSVIAPSAPLAAREGDVQTSTSTKQSSPAKSSPALVPIAAPLPATRPMESEPESPAQQMVRSLPMDIVLPLGGEDAIAERLRQRELQEWLDSPSPSRSRSRGRDKTRLQAHSRSASHDDRKPESQTRHGRKTSYDADASEEEEGPAVEDLRGRSRREKVLKENSSEERRGRGRERGVRT